MTAAVLRGDDRPWPTSPPVPWPAAGEPRDLVRLQALLSDHGEMDPVVDADRPSIEVWVVEGDGELRRWVLVGIGERTVTVMNPSEKYDRAVRQQRHVWIRPDAIAFRVRDLKGFRKTNRMTWTLEQGESGRRNALAAREARQGGLE